MTEVVRNRGQRKGNFRPGTDPEAVCLIRTGSAGFSRDFVVSPVSRRTDV